jgi:hypothetical protein
MLSEIAFIERYSTSENGEDAKNYVEVFKIIVYIFGENNNIVYIYENKLLKIVL